MYASQTSTKIKVRNKKYINRRRVSLIQEPVRIIWRYLTSQYSDDLGALAS